MYGFYSTDESDHPQAGLLGIMASLQWILILTLPLVQVPHSLYCVLLPPPTLCTVSYSPPPPHSLYCVLLPPPTLCTVFYSSPPLSVLCLNLPPPHSLYCVLISLPPTLCTVSYSPPTLCTVSHSPPPPHSLYCVLLLPPHSLYCVLISLPPTLCTVSYSPPPPTLCTVSHSPPPPLSVPCFTPPPLSVLCLTPPPPPPTVCVCVILLMHAMQAARVTKGCTKLKKSVSEVRSRPYSYKDTPQLDLDSLLNYTNGLNLSVSSTVVVCIHRLTAPSLLCMLAG